MFNTYLNDVSNKTNQIPIMTNEEYDEFISKLITDIYLKYGFFRSKL